MEGSALGTDGARFGVALGGGTARAYAHIGALRALERRGYRPDAIAGTSSGAVFGAMYALGTSTAELERFARELDAAAVWRLALDPGLGQAAIVHGRRLEAFLDRTVFGGAVFADARLPLAVACTDLATGELVVLRDGSIARAVVASCALPGVFAPVLDGPRALVDGGFAESVPFAALATLGPWKPLGIHAGIDVRRARLIALVRALHATAAGRAVAGWFGRRRGRNPWSRLGRGLTLAVASYERSIAAPPGGWLVTTRPPIAWLDFHRAADAIRAGDQAIDAALEGGGLAAWLEGSPSGGGCT
ncbi:MAG: patatin-like phospholipase family protein [Trueperaceae bacterium]